MMKRLLPLLMFPLAACSQSSPEPTRFMALDTTPVSTVPAVAPVQSGPTNTIWRYAQMLSGHSERRETASALS